MTETAPGDVPAPLAVEVACADDVGGREEQQDRVAVFHSDDEALLVVADGLGGHRDGARASAEVVATAEEVWQGLDRPFDSADTLLEHIRDRAHERIHSFGEGLPSPPMSTCALLYIAGRRAFWVHVGDSRLYHFRRGEVMSRTRDHSLAQVLYDRGEITETEMATRPEQAQLLSALGGEDVPHAESGGADLEAGDGFLLCSDGLWEVIRTEEMWEALVAGDLPAAAAGLAGLAAERGGPTGDNVAVALARLRDPQAEDTVGLMAGVGALLTAPIRLTRALNRRLRPKPKGGR